MPIHHVDRDDLHDVIVRLRRQHEEVMSIAPDSFDENQSPSSYVVVTQMLESGETR